MYKTVSLLCVCVCVSLAVSLGPSVTLYVDPCLWSTHNSCSHDREHNLYGYSSYLDVVAPNTTLNLDRRYANALSSLKVSPCTFAQMCVDSNLEGKCVIYINPCSAKTVLEKLNLMEDGINDAITSWKVLSISSLMSQPNSDDFKYTMSILKSDKAQINDERARLKIKYEQKLKPIDDLLILLTHSEHIISENS